MTDEEAAALEATVIRLQAKFRAQMKREISREGALRLIAAVLAEERRERADVVRIKLPPEFRRP